MYLRLKHVKRVAAKGKVYWYHQQTGERLPDDARARAERVVEINSGLKVREQPGPGSFAELIAQYRASPAFQKKKPKTRKDYTRYLDYIKEQWGDLAVSKIDREAVNGLRDKFAATPRKADYMVAVLSKILSFAVEYPSQYGLIANPAAKVERLYETDGIPPWPDDLISVFLEKAPPELRTIAAVGLYSGQRGQDCVRMLWSHYDGTGIEVAQEKTGKRIWIAAHRELRKVLDNLGRTAAVICVNKRGKPWKEDHLRHEIAKEVKRLGFAGYSFHGLRKAAAVRLAEAGCSEHQIASITGHASLQMIQHYTREANQKRLAKSAIRKLERKRDETD